MNYTPKVYENTTLGPIFSEMLYSNDLVAKNLVRILDKIKYKQVVTTLSGKLVSQAYAVSPVSGASTINFKDATIEPIKRHIFHEFEMDSLRSTRFGADMKSGAAQVESNEFLKAVLEWAVPQMGKAIEADWYTMVLAELIADATVLDVAGVPLTAENVKDEIGKIYAKLPKQVLKESKMYVPEGLTATIRQANLLEQFRDTFTFNGDNALYLGVPIVEGPLPDNTIFAGRSTDFVLGTDLASDFGQLEVGKDKPSSDLMFVKATYSLDAAVCIPAQKVLYKA